MANWEYKVISSGKGGFASPALLEKFLNDLGREEWEIIEFRTQADNALAFSGLARRSTLRDWTLEDAAAAAARNEAEKLRAEFEAKFRGSPAAASTASAEPEPEAAAADDGLRRLRDTSADQDPDAPEEGPADEWDALVTEDELPTFFEAIRPHLRRNQRGPGMSAGVEHLARRWNLTEEDIRGALLECGFVIPEDEDAKPAYLEFEGDLYWLNVNRRGELWINTREKPQPKFRTVAAQRVTPEEAEEPGPENEEGGKRQGRRRAEVDAPPAEPEPLPEGTALLERIRPLMRVNRRMPGASGSASFLSRALRCREPDLVAAFAALGLTEAAPDGKPPAVPFEDSIWWVDRDQRRGLWIHCREKSASGDESAPAEPGAAPASPAVAASDPGAVLAGVRLLLKKTRSGALAAETGRLAETLGRDREEFMAALTGTGLKIPEKPREKPVFVEHAGEIFWLNRNARNEIWLNSKASKFPAGQDDPGEAPHRPSRRKKPETETTPAPVELGETAGDGSDPG